jgi:FkbM family methyltransferase
MLKHKKIIYDFGANNGDDIAYYLQKCDKVVAVEANPALVEQIRSRFSQQINEGDLVVEHCVLTTDSNEQQVPFYIHKVNHVLSQFPRPQMSMLNEFNETLLPSRNVIKIINQHGNPYYIKIDLEHYDHVILKELFLHDIRPAFISAEAHDIEVFSALVTLGKYQSFNLVEGSGVEKKYKHSPIITKFGERIYSFPAHSAGPFGEDIQTKWMTANNFVTLLAAEQLGWKDIHATNEITADPKYQIRMADYLYRSVTGHLYYDTTKRAYDMIRTRTPLLYRTLKKINEFL